MESFPHLFPQESTSPWLRSSLLNQKELQAVCTHYPFYWNVESFGLIRGECIGSVATAQASRGKGIASQLLETLLDDLTAANVDFVFLFAQQPELYQKLGFYPVVCDYLATIQALPPTSFTPQGSLRVLEARTLDDELSRKLWCVLVQFSTARDPFISYADFKCMCNVPEMKLCLLQREDRVVSFAFFEKGEDFKNVLHSITYKDALDAIELVQLFYAQHRSPLFLALSEGDVELRRITQAEQQPTCLIRDLQFERKTKIPLRSFWNTFPMKIRSIQSC